MDEHLTREQIAAMLDEPRAVPEGASHLDTCGECASEYEAMSRTRMALSGLPDLAAPAGAWETIERSVPTQAHVAEGRSTAPTGWWMPTQRMWSPALAAAAVLILFLAGLGVGRMLAPAGGTDGGALTASADSPAMEMAEPRDADLDEHEQLERTFAELQALRRQGPTGEQLASDPAAVAERLTRLDALIEASREALRTAPADPALNDFLFDVVDERASVSGQLNQSIRQASMEY